MKQCQYIRLNYKSKHSKLMLSLIIILIKLFTLLSIELPSVLAQPVDINFDGNVDMMTSLRFQRHIWTATDGTIGIIVQRGTLGKPGESGLVFIRSIDNGATWDFVATIDDSPFSTADGIIDINNNKIWFVVSTIKEGVNSKYDVKFVLLDYDGISKNWIKIRENIIYDALSSTAGATASIAMDSLQRLWVSFRCSDSTNYWIEVMYSDDGGFTWKNSNHNFGIRNSSYNKFGKLIAFNNNIGIVYHDFDGITNIIKWAYRNDVDNLDIVNWIESDVNMMPPIEKWGSHFSVTTDKLGNVHLVYTYDYQKIIYQRYSKSWSLPANTYEGLSSYPNITTDGENLWVFFVLNSSSKQAQLVYKKYITLTDSWDTNISFVTDLFERSFDIKDFPTPPFNSGDSIYLGMSEKFDYISFKVLSSGISGTVLWEYWNGQDWLPLIVQESDNTDFQKNGYGFLRYEVPFDWAIMSVNKTAYYVVRGLIITSYSIDPVLKHFSAIKNNIRPSVPDRKANTIPVIWQEGIRAPFNIKYNLFLGD